MHIFETLPQSKCAVAYEILSLRGKSPEIEHIVIVYSTTAKQVLRILRAESEVTQMCTPQDDQILIVGTQVGSICLYDLTDFDSAVVRADFLDH